MHRSQTLLASDYCLNCTKVLKICFRKTPDVELVQTTRSARLSEAQSREKWRVDQCCLSRPVKDRSFRMGELTTSAREANLSPLFVAAYRFGCADAQLVTKIHPPADPVRLAIDSPPVTIKKRSQSTVSVTGLCPQCHDTNTKIKRR